MGYKFSGQEYDLTVEQGAAMVAMYHNPPFSMTDTVIAGVLAQFKKTVNAVVKKSAETIFADIRTKVLEDAVVKDTMPRLAKTWERYEAIGKQVDELEGIVLGIAKEQASKAGLLADGIKLGFSADDHKLVILPVKNGHGSSVAGSHRENGALRVTFLNDQLIARGSVIEGKNKQDLGAQMWAAFGSKWAGQKPYEYQGKTFYNRFADQVLNDTGLVNAVKVEKIAPNQT